MGAAVTVDGEATARVEGPGPPVSLRDPQGCVAVSEELFGVTGASIDRAWETTTGRPDVLIAVLDSGIRWAEQQGDLVDKFYLNRGELPVPEGSTNLRDPYDRNGDGLFNLADYRADATHGADGRVAWCDGGPLRHPDDLGPDGLAAPVLHRLGL